jgi:hypothetical protein
MALGTFGFLSIAHAVLALLVIIELGLTGYIVGQTDGVWWGTSPSQFNFQLFNSIWSILVLLYIAVIPVVLPSIFLTVVSFATLTLTALFWFAGSIALAVLIGVPDCHGSNFCQSVQAAVAFGFFLWAGFTALAVIDGMAYLKSRGPGARADIHAKPGRPYSGA